MSAASHRRSLRGASTGGADGGRASTGRAYAGRASTGRAYAGRFDFLVVGGGVVATVMAGLLLARKLTVPGRVAVIAERSPPTASAIVPQPTASAQTVSTSEAEWDLRVFALGRSSQRVLELCGAWQSLPASKRCAYERMRVWEDGPDAAGALTFDCAESGEPNLGFIVEGRALQTECRRAAAAAGVVFIEAALQEVSLADPQVCVRLKDGRELEGQLLIAADGAESTARSLLRIDTAGHAYHQDALVAHVRTERPHCSTAWQRFMPTGPLAFLPLPDGRSSIVWSTTREEAARLAALDRAAFGAAVTAASDGALGACELTTAVARFPLKLQYALDYVRPRAVLVGDAAHSVHPLAGQGLNLGLLDCAALADVLGADSRGAGGGYAGDHRVLRRYERWRRSENLLAATALDGLERLFASNNAVIAQLRRAGMGAVGRLPFIKRRLIERAMGQSGDVPAFLSAGAGG